MFYGQQEENYEFVEKFKYGTYLQKIESILVITHVGTIV